MKMRELCPDYFEPADIPYSHGVYRNGFVFTTQVGELPDGTMVSPNVYEQTVQVIKNAERVLKEAGGTLEDIVKVTIYMLDMRNEFGEMNRAYRECMPQNPFPARACVQVGSMVDGVKVEMEFTAMIDC